jgi:hypothetical protein
VRTIVPASVLLLAMSLPGCGGEATEDPATVVARAARVTFDRAPRTLSLEVASPNARWTGSGPIEPARGQFRVGVEAHRGVLIGPPHQTVVGTSGEGYETTFAEYRGGFINPRSRERCWFNPHLPVGASQETLSVEESARVTGSVLESLRSEIKEATTGGAGQYDVTLLPSATRPRDDFHDAERRVWGDRELLTMLDGPIRVSVGDGAIRSLDLRLGDYRPESLVRRSSPLPVSIRATFSSGPPALDLNPPRCQALE